MSVGVIFDIKKFALHDGPGLRTTVFFKGCPLACLLCHNPESRARGPELMSRRSGTGLCPGCSERFGAGAFSQRPGSRAVLSSPGEHLCDDCEALFLTGELHIAGREVTAAEVLDEIERDRVFYEESGGGATFSGGEPLAQPGFLELLLEGCRGLRIHTVVDTSGYASSDTIERMTGLVDLWHYDVKIMDEERHHAFTGVGNAPILENLRRLVREGEKVVVRMPLLPGINDDERNLTATGSFLTALPGPPPVDLLPFHRIGMDKYARLGVEHPMPDLQPPDESALARAADRLVSCGLDVSIRGVPHEPH